MLDFVHEQAASNRDSPVYADIEQAYEAELERKLELKRKVQMEEKEKQKQKHSSGVGRKKRSASSALLPGRHTNRSRKVNNGGATAEEEDVAKQPQPIPPSEFSDPLDLSWKYAQASDGAFPKRSSRVGAEYQVSADSIPVASSYASPVPGDQG